MPTPPSSPKPDIAIAIELHRQGDLESALAVYREILASDPSNSDALNLAGTVAYQCGDYALAEELISQAIELFPDMPDYHNNLGRVAERQGHVGIAADHYRQALRTKPDHVAAGENLARVTRQSVGTQPEGPAQTPAEEEVQHEMKLFYDLQKRWVECGGSADWAVSPECWQFISDHIQPGMQSLETGSGLSTWLFAAHGCDHTALEHSPDWFKQVQSPFVQNAQVRLCALGGSPTWYQWKPESVFDLVFIDGPPAGIGREGILRTIEVITHDDTIIVVDDVNRTGEARLGARLAEQLGWAFSILLEGNQRKFGVVKKCSS